MEGGETERDEEMGERTREGRKEGELGRKGKEGWMEDG